jgi:hypothetical protein
MKFYEIDSALQEAINAADKPIRLKIEIDLGNRFESIFEQDIIEANFWGLKEAAGGTSSRGELLLDNSYGIYSYSTAKHGNEIRVSFSLGEGLPFFQRFIFYIDEKGSLKSVVVVIVSARYKYRLLPMFHLKNK